MVVTKAGFWVSNSQDSTLLKNRPLAYLFAKVNAIFKPNFINMVNIIWFEALRDTNAVWNCIQRHPLTALIFNTDTLSLILYWNFLGTAFHLGDESWKQGFGKVTKNLPKTFAGTSEQSFSFPRNLDRIHSRWSSMKVLLPQSFPRQEKSLRSQNKVNINDNNNNDDNSKHAFL